MKLEELLKISQSPWHALSEEEVRSLGRFWDASDDDPELIDAIESERYLAEEIGRTCSESPAIQPDELIYVSMGNATTKDDYLRLVGRYGTPANQDLVQSPLLQYEALGEAVYRVCALMAFGERLAELSDIDEVLRIEERPPHLDMEVLLPARISLSVSIPDYRRAIMPGEIRIEDINEVYWPPMFNTAAGYSWKTPHGSWWTHRATKSREIPGLITYTLTVTASDENQHVHLNDQELRFFADALANSVINDQLADMRLSFRDGELDLVDALGAPQPPIWQSVWLALAQAKGKYVPSVCRCCGKLVDRRSERRNTAVSCTDAKRRCTSAYNNNGKRRMIKRAEWGREFKPDETFAYIETCRQDVLDTLAEQKADPSWPPL